MSQVYWAAPLIFCFVSGFVVGAVCYGVGRKIYWRIKIDRNRFKRYPARRFSRYGLRRRSSFLRSFHRAPYVRRPADYRLSKLLDRLEERYDD